MRNMKKLISLVLSLAVILSVMVVGTGAAFTDQNEITNTRAVDMCVALNIISGYPDGSYRPDGSITRAEFAKMICVMLNGGEDPAVATNSTPTFNDVRQNAAWAEGYIEYCYTKGIVDGTGKGRFNPTGNITAVQAAKMLLVALGYDADVEGYTGSNWALNVSVQANQDGLFDDLKGIDTGAALTRDNAAQMIWNTLQACIIQRSSSINRVNGAVTDIYTKKDGSDGNAKVELLERAYNADSDHGGVMTGFVYNSSRGEWTYYFTDVNKKHEDGAPAITIKSSVDYTDLYRQDCTVVYDQSSKDVYGIYADADDCRVLVSGTIANLDDMHANDDSVNILGTDYDFARTAATCPVYFFTYGSDAAVEGKYVGTIYSLTDGQSNDRQLDPFSFTAIDYDANDEIDCFVVYPYAVGQVSLLNSTKVGLKHLSDNDAYTLTANTLTEDLKDIDYYQGMAKDDYIVYTPAKYTTTNTADISPVDSVISGSVTRVSGSTVTIEGTRYISLATDTFAPGNKVKDCVVVGGYIFLVDGANSANIDDYVVVCKLGTDNFGGDVAQLLYTDGTKQSVTLEDTVDTDGNTIKRGVLYTYEKDSDGDYTLTPASTDAKTAGFDKVLGNTLSASSGKVKYIDSASIADDAVIFVQYNTTNAASGVASYKVITGAQLKKTSAANVTVLNAYANTSSSTNSSMVQMAFISTGTSSVASGEELYGYIVDTPATVKNADNTNVRELTIWTGTETITLLTDSMTTGANVGKRSVIEYTVNTSEEIDSIKVLMSYAIKDGSYVVKNNGVNAGAGIGAITSLDLSEPDVILTTYNYDTDGTITGIASVSDRLELDSKDTTILYIDNDEIVGYTDGSLQIASERSVNGALYYENCYYIIDMNGDELDLLVIDINNDILNQM